ncbi:MAG: MOSC domain-containing protein [bacterium]|nr:MOSC domain-containing protein [bacterium]
MVGRGKIAAISVSTEKGVPKTNVTHARLIENWGIEGDAHAGTWHRQISLLAVESIATIRALGLDVRPGDFAENITTQDIDLTALHIGDELVVGDCKLEITQIGKVCHARCSIYARVGDCVMPREGLFARVVCGGTIRVGDGVEAMTAVSAASQHG